MSTFSIGSFNFIDMSEFPPSTRESVEVETRAGVNGHSLWLTGKRGMPFSVRTIVDVATVTAGGLLMAQYEAVVGSQATVVYAGVPFNKTFDVLNVAPVENRKILLGIGGVSGTSGALLVADWSLVAIE